MEGNGLNSNLNIIIRKDNNKKSIFQENFGKSAWCYQ